MTAFTVEHAVELPENTILRAVLNELEIREIPKRDGGTFNRLKWHFEITQTGEYLGKKVTAETSAVLNDLEGNVFREWAEAPPETIAFLVIAAVVALASVPALTGGVPHRQGPKCAAVDWEQYLSGTGATHWR
jgi:hypothetical protein